MRHRVWALLPLPLLAPALRADDDSAARAVERLGGKAGRDEEAPGRPLAWVELSGFEVNDADLKELRAWRR